MQKFYQAVQHIKLLFVCDKGFPLEFGIGVRGPEYLNDGGTRWFKKF